MFQQEMRLPIDTEFLPSDLDAEEGDAETVDHTIEYLLSTRQTVFQKADSNIASAQKHQKETYDRKHQPQQIAEGTEVLQFPHLQGLQSTLLSQKNMFFSSN